MAAERDYPGRPFFLNVSIAPGALGTLSGDAKNDSGGEIEVLEIVRDVRTVANEAAAVAAPAALVKIVAADTDLQFQPAATATHIENLAGTAQRPAKLPSPIRIKPQSALTVSVQDLSNAASTYRFTFKARKVGSPK